MKKYLLLVLSISLLAATCRKVRKPIVIPAYIPQFAYGPNTLFKFHAISYDKKELELKVRLNRYDDTCSFKFSITNEYWSAGSITIPAIEMKTAIAHHSFTDEEITLKDETMMWMSQATFIDLKTIGHATIVPNFRDTVELVLKGKETLTTTIDGVSKVLQCIRAEGYASKKKMMQSYLILDDQRFPMIIAMETGWKVKLESISHLPAKAMTLQPELIEFTPGLKLIYTLNLYGCFSDIAFEFKEITADSVTFSYENYEYECLYGDADKEYSGTITISREMWDAPNDFTLFLLRPLVKFPASSYPGQPFFMHPSGFKTLFEKGKADCPISHTDYDPDEEDIEDMDSAEIEDKKKAAFLYTKTNFIIKESDVETGYRMFPLTINNEEKKVLAVKAVADLIGNEKTLYLYPSAKFPLYLYHYDDVLNIEWTLVAVEY